MEDERYAQLVYESAVVEEMTEEEFITTNPTAVWSRPYVLPFGRDYGKWNPRDVEAAPFQGREWLRGMTAIICRRLDQDRTRPTRLIFNSETIPQDHNSLGAQFAAYHDQTGAKLGEYEIAGLVIYDPDGYVLRIVGDVPDVKFNMSTYK